jgi:hypothetical protein
VVRRMTRQLLLVIAGLLLCLPAMAQQSATVARTFGIDGMSCAFWLSGPMQMRDGRAWILGYWAASNRLNAKNHQVGARSNTDAILVAVQDACRAGVAMSLPDATAQAYGRFERDGK